MELQHTMNKLKKFSQPNPLNFFSIRRVRKPIQYFEYITIPMAYNIEIALNKWIEGNLKGRYYIGKAITISSKTNTVESLIKVGFEEGKELAYFMLACPLLKYK